MEKSDSVVIIPTYNEKENIENIIRAVLGLEEHAFHILVIDDGSPDGTADIVKGLIANEFKNELHLVQRTGKLGLGTAYIAGFKWALEHGYEYVFEMDADFSHAPKDLPRLYNACAKEGYDVSVGSRYVSGVNVVNWPMGRVLIATMPRNMCVWLLVCLFTTLLLDLFAIVVRCSKQLTSMPSALRVTPSKLK